jgi:hypothetical protein
MIPYLAALKQWAKDFPMPGATPPLAAASASALAAKLPRGIRDNNPGNIRLGASIWQGAVRGSDPSFVTFSTLAYGVRAAALVFLHYRRIGLVSVRQYINRWAPPVENDTGAYVAAVAKGCGVSPDAIFDLSSKDNLQRLLAAVFIHENGGPFVSSEALSNGSNLALG